MNASAQESLLTSVEKPAPAPEHVPESGVVETAPMVLESAPAPKPLPVPKSSPAPNKTGGLTFTRRYTTAGQDVWATSEYELRTASIVGSDGTIVFEQKGVGNPQRLVRS